MDFPPAFADDISNTPRIDSSAGFQKFDICLARHICGVAILFIYISCPLQRRQPPAQRAYVVIDTSSGPSGYNKKLENCRSSSFPIQIIQVVNDGIERQGPFFSGTVCS